MKEFYHYTHENKVNDILRNGMYSNHPLFTTNQYFNADEAGQAVGVMSHYINCVLLFKDDGLFRLFNQPTVPRTSRFYKGDGASQYLHPYRPKPIAKRRISERNWTSF
jgi:hypothetical protein